MIAAMKLRIIAAGITVHDEVRQLIERRLNEHAARFGPFTVATITIEKGGLLELHSWKVKAEIELPPSWTVRPDGSAMGAIEDAIEAMFIELTALLRHVTWSRDGVPKPCRWCGHETFIYVRHPTDADDTASGAPLRLVKVDGEWRGELEALVCRACGYVDWFVRDPQRLPVGSRGIIEVTTRKADPYR